jgi:hypothetical protein
MEGEDQGHESGQPPDIDEIDGETDGPDLAGAGLGALGQLAAAVLAVAVLILAFIGGSVVLRRLFE